MIIKTVETEIDDMIMMKMKDDYAQLCAFSYYERQLLTSNRKISSVSMISCELIGAWKAPKSRLEEQIDCDYVKQLNVCR